jgi:S1-C subfamily serine protease
MTEPNTPHDPSHDPEAGDRTDAYGPVGPEGSPPHPPGDTGAEGPGAPGWPPSPGPSWAPPPHAGQPWGSWSPPPGSYPQGPGAYGHGYGGSGYGGPSYGGGGYYGGPGYGQPGYGHWGGPPPPRSRHTTILAVVAVAALVLLAAAVGGIAGHDLRSSNASSNRAGSPYYSTLPGGFGGSGSSSSGGRSSNGSGSPADVASIAAKVSPALVDVNVTFSYQQAQGAGTGIVLTPNGEILTNNHVINGATSISVTDVGNGQTYKASVVGYDPTHDLAVLQTQGASKLKTADIGTSSNLKTGEGVVGIGNAGGAGGTPSSAGGSITALNQSITAGDELDGTSEQLTGLIETNANIQSGDSGGSLVNGSGQVIGVDTAASQGFSFGGQSQGGGQGYAIPIDQAISTAKQIEAGKSSATVHVGPTAFLGVLVSTGNSNGGGQGQGGLGGQGGSSSSGATVSGVVANGAAANAGLAQGDVITSFDGQSVDSPTSLSHLLLPHHPGDKVPMTWTDTSGQSHTATVTLGSGPAS